MNKIIERARKHWGQKRSIAVPEWPDDDGAPTRIYWSPLTLDEQRKLRVLHEKKGDEDAVDYGLRVLIAKAEDETGTKLFTIEDRQALRGSADALVIDRIMVAMMSTQSVEDAVKN